MKKNNVLNATDLRNPDINRKNVKKQSKNFNYSDSFYANTKEFWKSWSSFLDDLVEGRVHVPDSVPPKFLDFYVKTSLQVAQILYNLRVLGNIEEYLLYQVEDPYECQKLDFTLFGKTDHLYLSKDSILSFLSVICNKQKLSLESYLHELDVISTKTDDDELPF